METCVQFYSVYTEVLLCFFHKHIITYLQVCISVTDLYLIQTASRILQCLVEKCSKIIKYANIQTVCNTIMWNKALHTIIINIQDRLVYRVCILLTQHEDESLRNNQPNICTYMFFFYPIWIISRYFFHSHQQAFGRNTV